MQNSEVMILNRKNWNKHIPTGVNQLMFIQLIISVLIASTLLIILGKKAALSAMLGGLLAIAPSFLFAKNLFKHKGARAARKIIKGFYFGEVLKIISTSVLFALVLKHLDTDPKVLFTTYSVILCAHLFMPLFFTNKQNILTTKNSCTKNRCL